MTNITLSIDDEVYNKMKKFSEIRWSEYVRKCIQKKVQELNVLEKSPSNESIMNMLASEEVLKQDWDNELDERWNNV